MKIAAMLLGVALVAPPQDKCTLELKSKKGDRLTVVDEDSMEMNFTYTEGKAAQEGTMAEKASMKYTDDVVEIDAEGWPTEVNRSIEEWRTEKKDLGETEFRKVTHEYEGKTLTLKLKDGRTSVAGHEKLERDAKKKLNLRKRIFVSAFPKGAVAVGTTWSIDEKALLTDFNDEQRDDDEGPRMVMNKGKAVGKLESLEGGKRNAATVVYEIEMEGTMMDWVKTTLKATVTATLDPDARRMIGLKATGTIEYDGATGEGDKKKAMTGKVEMKSSTSFSSN